MEEYINNDARVFFEGDLVCYNQRHHEWLEHAALWPSTHIPRTALRGTVLSTTKRTVVVKWDKAPEPTVHLPGNLEMLASRNYQEDEP